MVWTADSMTSAEAARLLGVTIRQIQRLAENGTIERTGQVGRSALLDANSVLRLSKIGVARGRQWNETTVWAALAMLDGRDQRVELDSSRRWHLRDRLRHMSAQDLVRVARCRATVVRYRVSVSLLDQLRSEVTLTGASALSTDVGLARAFKLSGVRAEHLDGYVIRGRLKDMQAQYFMVRDAGGNTTLRVTGAERQEGRIGSRATVALDLAESLDPRESSAGLRELRTMLRRI